MSSGKLLSALTLLLGLCLFSFRHKQEADHVKIFFSTKAPLFAKSADRLRFAVDRMKAGDSLSVHAARKALLDCRLAYKQIEFFLEHFIPVTARPFNLPPVHEVEEPYMEYQRPRGMQLMEAILFGDDPFGDMEELQSNAVLVQTYAADWRAMLYDLKITDEEVIRSCRLELIRIGTLGITGFDAPELKSGIIESKEAVSALHLVIRPYYPRLNKWLSDSLEYYFLKCENRLGSGIPFDDFDRLDFLSQALLPLQTEMLKMVKELELETDLGTALLDGNAAHLFSPSFIHVQGFDGADTTALQAKIILGKKLFSEPLLSGNRERSCSTCHQPQKFFTDGLVRSKTFDETASLDRNAPSLLYAAWQHGQFHDARAGSLEAQVKEVLQNPLEMQINWKQTKKGLSRDKAYRNMFRSAFPLHGKDSLISLNTIAAAIASFERTLAAFNSPFDRYIQGDRKALNAEQIKGFNLFAGKAQCAGCHFMPLFNGLLPPLYDITELEVLGTPATPDLKKPIYDPDSGRYKVFPISFHIGAFKTPTVRNAAQTAPYMHNGTFKTLEEVIKLYNEGGGEGIGLHTESQTLSSKKLQLKDDEIKAIVVFMESLSDQAVN